ncbi:MAG: hypothetical protein K2X95_02275, partial [Flavobacteriaceae bacterium]|nr:hypothetical protein [Flavobacteriaceae bacterium]
VAGNLAAGTGTVVFAIAGTPAQMGTATFNVTIGGASCSFNRSVKPAPLPINIVLNYIEPYRIVSAYDQDYLPYTVPVALASLTTAVPADGVNDTFTIDVQGTLTTAAASIIIPYTVVNDPVALPAFSQTITIPASYTQDGISRAITFSYPASTLPVGYGTITGTLQAVVGTLNVKKLDLQSGLGTDSLGWLLGQFSYATNSSGAAKFFDVRAFSGIPDRNFAQANYRMLYLPIVSGSITWLSNNLGADYANFSKPGFNPGQDAAAYNDYKAYGSLFQWGRYSDGHELVNWTSATAGAPINGFTYTRSTTDTPLNSLFILDSYDWRTTLNNTLWVGGAGTNNPCPVGYHVPTYVEGTLIISIGANGAHRFSYAGFRMPGDGVIYGAGVNGNYLCSPHDNAFNGGGTRIGVVESTMWQGERRSSGMSVRCVKN